jgi:hypothetical protein
MATWGFISLLFLPLLISEIFYKKKKREEGAQKTGPFSWEMVPQSQLL